MDRSTAVPPGRTRAWGELVAALLTALAWFAAEATGWKHLALGVLVAAWAAYLLARAWRQPSLWRDWGFHLEGWRRAALIHAGLAAVAVLAMVAFAAVRGRHGWTASVILVLALYPLWALLQQFLLQNIVVRNARLAGAPLSTLPLLAGAAFGFAHLPDWPLTALTFAAGAALTVLHARTGILWLLALTHALVGTAAFTLVLARDPLQEFPALAGAV